MTLTLHWADYVVYAIFLTVSVGIGVYHAFTGGKQRTTGEFIMADRKLKVIPTALSLLVSFQSAILILGATAEMYDFGTQWWFMNMISNSLAILLSERIFVPFFYPLKLVSINEYLELRFKSRSLRCFGSILSTMAGAMYVGVATYAPSLALETATGFPSKLSIPIMLGVTTIYTVLGGMRAVIWTDVFQAGIMFGGIIVILIWGSVQAGGASLMFQHLADRGRLQFADFNFDPTTRHTFWGFLIGYTVMMTKVYGSVQTAVQRYSAVETLKGARQVAYWNVLGVVVLLSLVNVLGVAVFAYYSNQQCDPLFTKQIGNSNQLLPQFVLAIFDNVPGIPGLFLATLYSGALSSISSSLSGMAANIWEDILKPHLSHRLTEFQAAMLTKALVAGLGLFGLAIAYLSSILPGTVSQMSWGLAASVSGPVFGLYLMGALCKWANAKGTLCGGVCAMLFLLWLKIGDIMTGTPLVTLPPIGTSNCSALGIHFNETYIPQKAMNVTGLPRLYSISYLWYVCLGVAITAAVGLPVSLLTGGKSHDVPEKYTITWKLVTSVGNDDGRPKKYQSVSSVPASEKVALGTLQDV